MRKERLLGVTWTDQCTAKAGTPGPTTLFALGPESFRCTALALEVTIR